MFQRDRKLPSRVWAVSMGQLHADSVRQHIRRQAAVVYPFCFRIKAVAARQLHLIKRQNPRRLPRIFILPTQIRPAEPVVISRFFTEIIARAADIGTEQQIMIICQRRQFFRLDFIIQPCRPLRPADTAYLTASVLPAILRRGIIGVLIDRRADTARKTPARQPLRFFPKTPHIFQNRRRQI